MGAEVRIQHAGQWYRYCEVESLKQAIENAKAVLRQTERKLEQQRQLLAKFEAGLPELEAQVAAEKERKAEQRRLKRACA